MGDGDSIEPLSQIPPYYVTFSEKGRFLKTRLKMRVAVDEVGGECRQYPCCVIVEYSLFGKTLRSKNLDWNHPEAQKIAQKYGVNLD
jgi:hypothetical protein